MASSTAPVAIFMTGLPGTGKTYVARHLAADIQAQHVSSDRVRKTMQKTGKYRPEDKAAVYTQMQKMLAETLADKQTVIVDMTFYQRTLRTTFSNIAKRYTDRIYWVQTTASETVVRRRVSHKRPDSEADFEVYLLLKKQFEPLEMPHLTIHTNQTDIEENLRHIKQYCAIL